MGPSARRTGAGAGPWFVLFKLEALWYANQPPICRGFKPFWRRRFNWDGGSEAVGAFKENASGTKNDRVARNKVMTLALARAVDAILVTELSQWRLSGPNFGSNVHVTSKMSYTQSTFV
jgi:hypothetical protein